ncbi:MAG: NADP-dependent isocitrate dehydrogenase, partial [Acidimicrobiales bacterium]|nr:NADP-dependent isocitrate dehydrogenase [Acidimicrobiales bacterium]
YWAKALADQTDNSEVAAKFAPLAAALAASETAIVDELNAVQGQPMDIGGYYAPDEALATAAMRPSATLNTLLADFIA